MPFLITPKAFLDTMIDVLIRCCRFSVPPPLSVLRKLIDVYFANCQNEPYCFFHESTMRKRLLDGEVPRYLVLAFAATATRYSMHPYFEDKQIAAVEAYAKASWAILLERVFAGDDCIDITVAQATVLLAIIEYTGEISILSRIASMSLIKNVSTQLAKVVLPGSSLVWPLVLYRISN